VLPSINLYDELCGVTDEIHDVWADWRLAPKARAVHAMRT
jgi:hypothetical protein